MKGKKTVKLSQMMRLKEFLGDLAYALEVLPPTVLLTFIRGSIDPMQMEEVGDTTLTAREVDKFLRRLTESGHVAVATHVRVAAPKPRKKKRGTR